ncbi:MAG: 2,5-dichloro-2,5-cyclohexadiene,4-diol dehydrogenase, partial [Phenylobacterium sp.]|nr:2,5-dichloro-2,5-cyclohexadiene,4-diol dehydrogenase [Phenylobacterium sp.]
TGGAQGLGAAMARMLVAEGAKVSIADINHEGAKAIAAEINAAHGEGTAFAFPLDVTKEDQWIYALEEADAAMGGISVLVNNAGISRGGNIEQLSYEDWKLVMSVNVDSVFRGTKHALKYMRAHQPGSIINISSIAGLIAAHNSPVYNASKAGVWLLSKGIALHCAKQGLDIRSNSIHPTFIDTPILDPLRQQFGTEVAHGKLARQIPLGHIGEPDDIANAVLYLASDESKFMTGAELKLDGGISAM